MHDSDFPSRPSGYVARPDYLVELRRRTNRVEAHAAVQRLAASDHTIFVAEQDHALVVYFPRADVDMAALVAVAGQQTHCPFKGDAHYFALASDPSQPVAWSYAAPYPEVALLADHIAFYDTEVEIVLGRRRD